MRKCAQAPDRRPLCTGVWFSGSPDRVCMCMSVCVCTCVCMCVCVFVCLSVRADVCTYVSECVVRAWLYAVLWMQVCFCICMCAFLREYVYVCV
jgi:hypothetical protein